MLLAESFSGTFHKKPLWYFSSTNSPTLCLLFNDINFFKHQNTVFSVLLKKKHIRTARTETVIWCKETQNFLPSVHGGRVSEKNLGVSALQDAEPPYSVNSGPKNKFGKHR